MTEKSINKGECQSADTVAIENYLSENQERLDKVSRGFANRIIAQLNKQVGDIRSSTDNQIKQNYLSCVNDVTNEINVSFIESDNAIKDIQNGNSVIPQMIPYKTKAIIDKFDNKCKTGLNRVKLLGEIPTDLENNISEMKQILSSYSQ